MSAVAGSRDKLFNNPIRAERFRVSIRVGLIRNRLMKHILGELELSSTQIQAAKILLDKSVGNVSQVEVSGPGGGPIEVATPLHHETSAQILDRIRADSRITADGTATQA